MAVNPLKLGVKRMSLPTLDLSWFLSTAYGKVWANSNLDPIVYENAYLLASTDVRMIDVKNNCPDIYSNALSLYIAIILTQGGTESAAVINPTQTDKVAYVVSDKVYDVERKYSLVDAPSEISGALPANTLSRIFEQCKSIVVGMRLVKSALGCNSCGGGSSNGLNIGDTADG